MSAAKKLCILSFRQENANKWKAYLQAADWDVRVFADIPASLQYIRQQNPSVAVLDIPLSDIDEHFSNLGGLESSTAYITVLEKPSQMEVVNCFRSDATDVLIKPFNRKALLSAVERACKYQQLVNQNRLYKEQLEASNRILSDNLRILEMDHLAGRQIQQSMLPETPQRFGEYEIAHHIVSSLYMSGDFVGYHVIFDRYLVFYAADVSGHGASSAVLTVVLRLLLSRILRRHIDNDDREAMTRAPEGFIEYLNKQILAIGIDKHLTIFAASIDMKRNILRYSVGAHMPMPVFIADDKCEVLPGRGKPIGIFENIEWQVEEKQLPDKFAIVLTSDGALEIAEGNDLIEKEHFIWDAVKRSDTSMESLCQNLGLIHMESAPDDITVLTVRRGYPSD